MQTFKELISSPTTRKQALAIGAPEFGDGIVAHVRQLTVQDRNQIKDDEANHAMSKSERYSRKVYLCAANDDGEHAFTGPDDPVIPLVPASLADRIIRVAMAAQ